MTQPTIFEDLEVEVSPRGSRGLEVRVLRSLFNRPRGKFRAPYKPGEARRLVADLGCELSRFLKEKSTKSGGNARWQGPDLEEVGGKLFKALFGEDSVQKTVHLCLGEVLSEARPELGLRVRLSFDTETETAQAAAALPWELLHNGRRFLAHDLETPVVRYIDSPEPRRRLETETPLRVLLVAANPRTRAGGHKLDLESERQAIEKAVTKAGGEIEVRTLQEPTMEKLQEAIRPSGGPNVVHFMGHGGFDEEGGFVVFEDAGGERAVVTDRMLRTLLPQSNALRLVILASCKGAISGRQPGKRYLTGVAAGLSQHGLPAVVGMQFIVSDRAAARFSGAFYASLTRREPLETAVTEGRLAVFLEDEHSLEWASPVLYLRTADGQLLKPAEAGAPVAREETGPRTLGIFSFEGWGKELREEAKPKHILDLVPYFDDRSHRYIRNAALWPVVGAEVARFLPGVVARDRENVLEFAAHLSIAFAAGYSLEAMAGYQLAVQQRGRDGISLWRSNEGELPPGPLWKELDVEEVRGTGPGLAVVLSLSQQAAETVREFLGRKKLPVQQLLVATLPQVSHGGIKSGKHASQLAEALHYKIRELRPYDTQGEVHLFPAGPTGFAFYLGRLARDWGPIQLWEYDREKKFDQPYLESILLGKGAGDA